MSLQRLEIEILQLHNGLSLRPTLETVVAIGCRLAEAKGLVQHGEWLPWLKRVGLAPRTAQTYMQVYKFDPTDKELSLSKFLSLMKDARRASSRALVQELRSAAVGCRQRGSVRLLCADCKKYDWPSGLDMICTDPPWGDVESYKWLGEFASSHLREGGLLLVQLGTGKVAEQLACLSDLNFVWLLALVYKNVPSYRAVGGMPFLSSFRPVALLSRGDFDKKLFATISDTYHCQFQAKQFHDWEQPVKPFRYWLERLARPGWVIADPFAGSGTVGVAVLEIGGMSYIGTEIDPASARVAQERLNETKDPAKVTD